MPSYAVFGAGDIGCTVGIALAAHGASVALVGRNSPTGLALRNAAVENGARVCHKRSKWTVSLTPRQCASIFTADATRLREADVIIVATKRADNVAAAQAVAQHARPGAVVLMLQNGVGTAAELRGLLPPGTDVQIVECVVSMNAVRDVSDGALFHWVSPRDPSNPSFLLSAAGESIAADMHAAGLLAVSTQSFEEVVHAKLLINSAYNATVSLSGLNSLQCLREPAYRRIMHAAIDEALEVYKGAGIAYEKAGVFKYIKFLKLPQPIVWCIVPFLLADEARPSMYADLENNRKTEVRYINGHIIQLGKKAGVPTPVNQRLVDLVEAAERAAAGSPKVSAASIARWTLTP